MKGITNIKTILGASALFIFTGGAQANLVTIETNHPGDNTVAISGYQNSVTGPVTSGLFGTLAADGEVRATFTYLGQESGHFNLFVGETALLTEFGKAGSTSISETMGPGDLDFHFVDLNGLDVVANSEGRDFYQNSPNIPPAFAILNAAIAGYDYILGFNDTFNGDTDYDDFVVGLNVAATPLPPAAWLFGSALVGIGALVRRSRAHSKAEAVAA